jgi:Fur family ferric uptake transcriptional regulator
MNHETHDALVAGDRRDVEALVRGAGLRRTTSRVEVLRVLVETRQPMSHPEVMIALRSHRLDRVTVYRNLLDLAEAGVLRRFDHGDHVWRYALVDDEHGRAHPHFVCVECGRVSCLSDVSVAIRTSADAPRSVRARDVSVRLSGCCDECSER